jgi:hypothetical protein
MKPSFIALIAHGQKSANNPFDDWITSNGYLSRYPLASLKNWHNSFYFNALKQVSVAFINATAS